VIGLDTNVLVRYFTQDDAGQVALVDALIAKSKNDGIRLHIDEVVLCELAWVLRGAYRFDRHAISATLERMLAASMFSFDDRDLLRRALGQYTEGDGDFADYVIGARNAKAGCTSTATFDRALNGDEGFSLLRPKPPE
jgi:predicted nucleic-acid-binding protein